MAHQEAVPSAVSAPAPAAQGDVLTVIHGSHEYSIFATMLQRSGLASILTGEGPFTVFVPTNAAMSALPPGTVEQLLQPENKSRLAALVTSHILPGKVTSDTWAQSPQVGITLGGDPVVYAHGPHEQVNNAPVIARDIPATNGVVHVVNGVLKAPGN